MPAGLSDQKVFKEVYLKHSREVRNFLYYKCGDEAQAEDFMQEAFLRLWKARDKVPVEKAVGFLFTVGNRLFLDHIKHKKVSLKFQQRQTNKSEREDPEFLYEQQEFKERLEKAINDMPEKWRVVFLMSRMEKMKYSEIAERLDISVKAVEKRMHNALSALRELHKKI
ncbi:MAG: sigma-70 family RNA polymerase sigma factor [Saprospiraceae bacterium]|nr:sigma-70 family RNA polymerase sigma factor [Saprospiraceae bacterium]